MPGYVVPARPTVLEGDYSDWTIHDSFDDENVADIVDHQYVIVNKTETVALLAYLEVFLTRSYTISTKTVGYAGAMYLLPGWDGSRNRALLDHASLQRTYVVGLIYAAGFVANGIAVWKDGEIIATYSATDLGFDANSVYSVSISPSGKYIFVTGLRTATGNLGWVVLVGS